MRQPAYSSHFKRDYKRAKKRLKNMGAMKEVMDLLIQAAELPPAYNDHPLKGKWQGFRELHIEPDWLLIYRLTENAVCFIRTGTHADHFSE